MISNSGCCSLLELLEGDIFVDEEEDENERALTKAEFGWLRCSVRPAELFRRRTVHKILHIVFFSIPNSRVPTAIHFCWLWT